MEQDDLSVDELLEAALAKTKPMRSKTEHTFDSKPTPQWAWIPITYLCTKCNRRYKGQLFHPSDDIFTKPNDQKETPWCPRCIDEALWWLHCKFEVGGVIESESI